MGLYFPRNIGLSDLCMLGSEIGSNCDLTQIIDTVYQSQSFTDFNRAGQLNFKVSEFIFKSKISITIND